MTIYPPVMKAMSNDPRVLRYWVSDIKPTHPNECDNCGGSGSLVIQCAYAGPFSSAPGFSRTDNLASKFDTDDGTWWLVKTDEFRCPICNGLGLKKAPVISRAAPAAYRPAVKEVVTSWDSRKDLE
jgi:hypothetical protein